VIQAASEALDDPVTRWSALVIAVGGVILGVLYAVVKLRKLAADLGIVKTEVKNNHTTNLREEADDRHEENARKLDALLDITASNTRQIASISGQVNSLFGRMNDVERTQDRRPE